MTTDDYIDDELQSTVRGAYRGALSGRNITIKPTLNSWKKDDVIPSRRKGHWLVIWDSQPAGRVFRTQVIMIRKPPETTGARIPTNSRPPRPSVAVMAAQAHHARARTTVMVAPAVIGAVADRKAEEAATASTQWIGPTPVWDELPDGERVLRVQGPDESPVDVQMGRDPVGMFMKALRWFIPPGSPGRPS